MTIVKIEGVPDLTEIDVQAGLQYDSNKLLYEPIARLFDGLGVKLVKIVVSQRSIAVGGEVK